MFEKRYAELERKIKHGAETAATAQKSKMTESSTMSEKAEGGVIAKVALQQQRIWMKTQMQQHKSR